MYRGKNRDEKYLFEELMPFGGQLAEGNRWLKIKGLIPWEELEREYASYFSKQGRPALDGRLVIGLFLLKHMTVLSDVGVVLELQENVYWQAFCGMEQFETGKKLDASSLTKIRHKLGPKFVKDLETKTYRVLIEKKIIRGKGMLVDATVMPEKIRYPNDVGLLNDVREWTVGWLKEVVKVTGEKIRTYRRKARKLFLNFSKKKLKTRFSEAIKGGFLMGESQMTAKESTKELVKLSCLVATAFILLINVLGFAITKFYMARAMILPVPTRMLIELQHALRINIFFTIPIVVFVIIFFFLLENFAVKSHASTYGIYKK